MRGFLIALILIPVLELWLLIEVGTHIGALPTVALIVLTAVVGMFLIRRQGLSTLTSADLRARQGEVPAMEMLEGLVLALAGIMLLAPGFATDFVGFACLVPPVRRAIIGRWLRRVQVQAHYYSGEYHQVDPHRPVERAGRTLEGDYRRDDGPEDR